MIREATATPPVVEALIVSFNTCELLAQTLSSLFDHNPPPQVCTVRVSVCDNGSTDGSADMVEADFPAVHLIRSSANLGFGVANNLLAKQSSADYLLLVNSDVIFTEDVISPLLAALDDDPAAVLSAPRLVLPDGEVQLSAQALPDILYEVAVGLQGTRLGRVLAPWFDAGKRVSDVLQRDLTDSKVSGRHPEVIFATCWLVRAQLVREFLFDPSFTMYYEDLDFCRRAKKLGWQLVYVPEAELVHLGSASSTSRTRRRLLRKARFLYYRRQLGLLRATALWLALGLIKALVLIGARIPTLRTFKLDAT
jgi:N-acetylglucosaminyl-diphospho-decaprenol L-rhamnosyltransferase